MKKDLNGNLNSLKEHMLRQDEKLAYLKTVKLVLENKVMRLEYENNQLKRELKKLALKLQQQSKPVLPEFQKSIVIEERKEVKKSLGFWWVVLIYYSIVCAILGIVYQLSRK